MTAAPSPTGDPSTDALLPLAGRLVGAAHDNDATGIEAALGEAEQLLGDSLAATRALVVVLAAMCDDDATPAELLAWRSNPTEYQRLRGLGVDTRTAAVLAATASPSRKDTAA
ncbi:hypothetical protein GCM10010174_69850 [Kutzneria viridogrisea]|uniref:Uncharacterized protein n=1 Tax=Kutzneria viridogrisea TaxID=47990 RepID=A0ABR6BBD2_9PSEU|nr:hypothetical protein [Kutzneria viridogrisea]